MSNDIEPTTRKSITLPDAMWREVADFRFSERIATETEAVRRLIDLGLRAAVQAVEQSA